MEMSPSTILKIKDLSKKYRRRTVLSNVSFTVNAGDCIGIVGANGCGKSTLLRILAGADKPDSGALEYFGKDPFRNRQLFSRQVGYIPQENPLFENLTVLDNLRLWYCETGVDLNKELTEGRLAVFGLFPYRSYPVRKLSGGMKKRLSIACSIAKNPPVLILDEPGASLDILCKEDICRYLTDYRKGGGTILITSHEEGELALCSRMLLIKNASLTEIPPVTGTRLMKLIRPEAAHV